MSRQQPQIPKRISSINFGLLNLMRFGRCPLWK